VDGTWSQVTKVMRYLEDFCLPKVKLTEVNCFCITTFLFNFFSMESSISVKTLCFMIAGDFNSASVYIN
jgi:hypothetical protein